MEWPSHPTVPKRPSDFSLFEGSGNLPGRGFRVKETPPLPRATIQALNNH